MNHDTSPTGQAENRKPSSPIRISLSGLAALGVAMGIGRFAFTPIMPLMLRDAGLTLSQSSWLASANYVGYLIGALTPILLPSRPVRLIRFGLLGIVATTAGMGFSHTFVVWLVLRLLAGIASAWILIGISIWSYERLRTFRQPFFESLVFAGVGIGIATAGLVCIVLVGNGVGSSASWTAFAILAIGTTALIWKQFSTVQPTVALPPTQKMAGFTWDADSIRLVLCYGIFGFGYILPATYLPVMAKEALQGSEAYVWTWPVFGLAAAMSTLLVATLTQRVGIRRIWAISHWIMAGGILLPVWWPNVLSIFTAAICVGGTFMIVTLVAMVEARSIAKSGATVLVSAMTSAFAAGQIIGPFTVSGGQGNSFSTGLVIAAVLLAASTLLLKKSPRAP